MATNSTNDLLASLHDIEFVAVEASNLPGIAWWVSGFIVLLIIVVLIYLSRKIINKNHYRKAALSLLKQASINENSNSDKLLAYNAIVKRAALTAFPNSDVDRLYGKQWLDFLNTHTKKAVFAPELIELWHNSQFSEHSSIDAHAFYRSCKQWLKQHRLHQQNGANHV